MIDEEHPGHGWRPDSGTPPRIVCDLCSLEGSWHLVFAARPVKVAAMCCRCFGRLYGAEVRDWCEEFWAGARVAKLLADSKEEI